MAIGKKSCLTGALIFLLPALCAAGEGSFPWEEYGNLFKSQVRTQLLREMKPPEKERFRYSVDEAHYSVELLGNSVSGQLCISGKVISGEVQPIPVLAEKTTLAGSIETEACALLRKDQLSGAISILPEPGKNFSLKLSFLEKLDEDQKSKFFCLPETHALHSSVKIKLPKGYRLTSAPGISDKDAVFHFNSEAPRIIRFAKQGKVQEDRLIDVDMFTLLRIQGRRLLLSSAFMPGRMSNSPFEIVVPEELQFISSSLKGSWIKKVANGNYRVNLPEKFDQIFKIRFAAMSGKVVLPGIADNGGKEGLFSVEEPDDGQVSVRGPELVRNLPMEALPAAFSAEIPDSAEIIRAKPGSTIGISLTRFKTISTPEVVLSTLSCFISYEENGSVLTVLEMELPKEVGRKLTICRPTQGTIWSSTVNGKKVRIYAKDSDKWVIPLSSEQRSKLRLAILQKSQKLSIHGRLEAILPALHIPARKLQVVIGLPERVELVSLEGAITPQKLKEVAYPPEFTGRPHLFSCNFYKGQEMKVALFYREPVAEN